MDPTGSTTHGIGHIQIFNSARNTIENNQFVGVTPQGGNGDIDGIVLFGAFSNGHVVRNNAITSLAHHYSDQTSGGVKNLFTGNLSYFPSVQDYGFTNSYASGNFAAGVPVSDTYSVASLPALIAYTASTLPSGAPAGTIAYVTDATSPTYGGAITGGGAVKTLALYNGTSWTAH